MGTNYGSYSFTTPPAGWTTDANGDWVQGPGIGNFNSRNHTFSIPAPSPTLPNHHFSRGVSSNAGMRPPYQQLAPVQPVIMEQPTFWPQAQLGYDVTPIVSGGYYFNPPPRQSELERVIIIVIFAITGAVIGILIQLAIKGIRALVRKIRSR